MAVQATAVVSSNLFKTWTCQWTADADTDLVITHGMTSAALSTGGDLGRGTTPDIVTFTPIHDDFYGAAFASSQRIVLGTVNATTITLTKNTGTGSGSAEDTVLVTATFFVPGSVPLSATDSST
jgi:hypothetical protein